MAESLKQKTVKGLIWSGVERILGQVVSFTLALILARLVTPADYGTLAIVMVFVTISGLMVDAGFANALIRKVDCTDVDRSTVLYFNIIVSLLIYVILYTVSPLISNFYNNEDLTALIRCASVVVVISSLSIVQQATLMSRIDFKKQTLISLASSITSGGVGIYLAYRGFGVWALVAQTIILSLMRCIMLWSIVRWRPLFVFSKESFKDLFGYSSKLMLSNLIAQGGQQTIQLLLGKYYSMSNLGYYNYSTKLGSFIPFNIANSIQRVLFPAFSQIQSDEVALVRNFRLSLVLSMAFIVPIMFCISALAKPIIILLLTEEWLPIIPILTIVSITQAFFPLLLFNMNILWVKKRSDISLYLEIISMVNKLLIIIFLFQYELLGVCIALLVAEFVNFLIYAIFVGRIATYGIIAQIKDLIPIFIPAIISSFVIKNVPLDNYSAGINIALGGGLYAIVYFCSLYLIHSYIRNIIKSRFKST